MPNVPIIRGYVPLGNLSRQIFEGIKYSIQTTREFFADDKVTSAIFVTLTEAEGDAIDWDNKKAILIIKTIEKTLSALLLFNSVIYALLNKKAAENRTPQPEATPAPNVVSDTGGPQDISVMRI